MTTVDGRLVLNVQRCVITHEPCTTSHLAPCHVHVPTASYFSCACGRQVRASSGGHLLRLGAMDCGTLGGGAAGGGATGGSETGGSEMGGSLVDPTRSHARSAAHPLNCPSLRPLLTQPPLARPPAPLARLPLARRPFARRPFARRPFARPLTASVVNSSLGVGPLGDGIVA